MIEKLELKENQLIVWPNIWYDPHNDINSLSSKHAVFLELFHDWLTGYSSGKEQGWRKTDDLTELFGLLHHAKQIATRPVF